MATVPDFSVVDTETTGFRFDKGARLLEVAVVRISPDGAVQGTFSSLVNPGDGVDVGATDIHGITRDMIDDAPSFADIAGDFVSLVRGSFLVAHNASFDTPFLSGEMELAGHAWPAQQVYDTLGAARFLVPGLASYKLAHLAEHFGIVFPGNAHAALADAMVTAQLHAELLARTSDRVRWPDPSQVFWPEIAPTGLAKQR